MTEISYIMQNGQQVNLKDATGRELLATKQTKLKAGRGISIAADGTISVIGGGSSAKGFFINASGELSNLTFDKTPAELASAIEAGDIVIVNANNAKFILADVNDNTYLFSYLVAVGDDCLAQIATIVATGTGETWTEIKTNFVAIKAGSSDNGEDIYHEDDDLGVDFSDWNEYQKQDNLAFVESDSWGGTNQVAHYVDENGDEISESLVNQYGNENPEVTSRVQGIKFGSYYRANSYINQDFITDNNGELELDVIRFKDGFNMAIEDGELQDQLSSYQDTLVIGEGLEISEDGIISIKE